jgi:hypothetical protein
LFCARLLCKSEIPAGHLSATTTHCRDHLIAEALEAWTQKVLKRLEVQVHSRVKKKNFRSFVGRRLFVSPIDAVGEN